ncbi:hypothetical protein J3D48_004174 [Pseudomonas fluorescens]|uniref:hypothetical protein n=1 Tax=Pseudomonas fluorescens TaxID=294 RepID=UPI000F054BD3|nr:hypothetical protein [Pseudomonas fluorescens]MCP1487861.1 hypothetical protein [Pseudomonas fluorescens]
MGIVRMAAAMLVLLFISGCTFHQQWRDETQVCVIDRSEDGSDQCERAQLQKRQGPGEYTIGYVEFNDQGELFSRQQMNDVLGALQEKAGRGDVLMVVFAHGWNHRAKEGDGNINTFRKVLENVSLTEAKDANEKQRPRREVFGIYLGWRGLSLRVPVLEFLTFWDRKNTSAKVGAGDVTELLSRIELVKRTRDAIKAQEVTESVIASCKDHPCIDELDKAKAAKSDTRLVVIGHSFGGLVVQSAIDRVLIDRAIRTGGAGAGYQGTIEGFGNLVILINPAFEAQRFNSMFKLQDERKTYFDDQLPVELVLTSRRDYATKFAFPVGRAFSSAFEKKGWASKNLQTIGHYESFVTHTLNTPTPELLKSPQYADCFNDPATIAHSWYSGDRKGNRHIFGGLILERDKLSERSPFLNVSVSGDLITGHNDVDEDLIIKFASRMISLSSITERQKKSAAEKVVNLKSCDLALQ